MPYPIWAARLWFAGSVLCAGLVTAAPAGAQSADAPAKPIPVMLDLYAGDKNSKGFADALTAAISGDDRFDLVQTLPADGMKISMTDALLRQTDDMDNKAAYDVVLKLANGKFIGEKQGLCDLARLPMCGRVVAQDSFDAYQDYMAHHKAK
jgi:hypothetical protein